MPDLEPLPLAAALAALQAVAATLRAPPTPRRLAAAHADFWRFDVGVALRPFEAVSPLALLSANGRHLAALLIATCQREAALRAAVGRWAQAAHAGHAAHADPPTRSQGADARSLPVLIDTALDAESTLEAVRVAAEPARAEELLRRLARRAGAPILQPAGPEAPERSAAIFERLDSAALRAEEVRLRRQQRLMEAARRARDLIATGADLG